MLSLSSTHPEYVAEGEGGGGRGAGVCKVHGGGGRGGCLVSGCGDRSSRRGDVPFLCCGEDATLPDVYKFMSLY